MKKTVIRGVRGSFMLFRKRRLIVKLSARRCQLSPAFQLPTEVQSCWPPFSLGVFRGTLETSLQSCTMLGQLPESDCCAHSLRQMLFLNKKAVNLPNVPISNVYTERLLGNSSNMRNTGAHTSPWGVLEIN